MIDIERRSAGVLAAIVGLVVILLVYIFFGTVDLVFKKGENEVCYVENASFFSDLDLDGSDIKGGQMLEFTYGENDAVFANDFNFKIEIAKTLIVNLFTFKWSESNYVITLHAN